jgi:hypothetical protein
MWRTAGKTLNPKPYNIFSCRYFHHHWSRPHTVEEYRGIFLEMDGTDVLPYCVVEQV